MKNFTFFIDDVLKSGNFTDLPSIQLNLKDLIKRSPDCLHLSAFQLSQETYKYLIQHGFNPIEYCSGGVALELLKCHLDIPFDPSTMAFTPNNLLELATMQYTKTDEHKRIQENLVKYSIENGAAYNRDIQFPQSQSVSIPIQSLFDYSNLLITIMPIEQFAGAVLYADTSLDVCEGESGLSVMQLQLIKETISNGLKWIKFRGMLQFSCNILYVLSSLKTVFLEKYGPTVFLHFILNAATYLDDMHQLNDYKKITLEMIKFAIDNGADLNHKFDMPFGLIGSAPDDNDIIQLLQKYGAKCDIMQQSLEELSYQTSSASEMRYKHLSATPTASIKIPHTVYYIWLTSPIAPKEMRIVDIKNICANSLVLGQDWSSIVFTNDPTLLPLTEYRLKMCGAQLVSMYEHRYHIRGFNIIEDLVEQSKWGMASDFLRYSLIWHFGGVYADANFAISRSLNKETQTYNFVTMEYSDDSFNIDNFFFMASRHHPVIDAIIYRTEKNLLNPPSQIAAMEDQSSRSITDFSTAGPMTLGYYDAANKNGSVDVVYPYVLKDNEGYPDEYFRTFVEENEQLIKSASYRCPSEIDPTSFAKYASHWGMCGDKDQHPLGIDGKGGGDNWVSNS